MTIHETREQRMTADAQVRREVLGGVHVDAGPTAPAPFQAAFVAFTEEYCWGNVWLRPRLERKTRSMLNLAMLAVMGRWHEFEVHVRGAVNNGVSDEEITEILLQVGVYAGVPVAAEGFRRARRIVAQHREKTENGDGRSS